MTQWPSLWFNLITVTESTHWLTDRNLTHRIIKAIVILHAKHGHFLPRANFLQRIVRVTHHMLWSTDSPHPPSLHPLVTHPLSHLFIAAWLTGPPPLINQPCRLTNLFSWRKKLANVPPRPIERPTAGHTSLSTGGRRQATFAKVTGFLGQSAHSADWRGSAWTYCRMNWTASSYFIPHSIKASATITGALWRARITIKIKKKKKNFHHETVEIKMKGGVKTWD